MICLVEQKDDFCDGIVFASSDNPSTTSIFGYNVGAMWSLTYAYGATSFMHLLRLQ